MTIPQRPLGRTGHQATILGLGGEGVLRTYGEEKEAQAVIEAALTRASDISSRPGPIPAAKLTWARD